MPKRFCWPLYRITQGDCCASQHGWCFGTAASSLGTGLWEGTLEVCAFSQVSYSYLEASQGKGTFLVT